MISNKLINNNICICYFLLVTVFSNRLCFNKKLLKNTKTTFSALLLRQKVNIKIKKKNLSLVEYVLRNEHQFMYLYRLEE